MFRSICLILLVAVIGSFIHADSLFLGMSFDCAEILDVCDKLENKQAEKRPSSQEKKECASDCHCPNGQLLAEANVEPDERQVIAGLDLKNLYPEIRSSHPKNYFRRIHRPPKAQSFS